MERPPVLPFDTSITFPDAKPHSPADRIASNVPNAPIHPPHCVRSFRSNHICDLLGGLPPARHGPGRNYLEADPDNPIPWAVTDTAYARFRQGDGEETAAVLKDLKEERQRYTDKHTPVLRPKSPKHYSDFSGPRPQGDPQPSTSRHPHRDGRLWTRQERRDFFGEAMMIKFPPDIKGVVETRNRSKSKSKSEDLKGFQPELDAMVEVRSLKTSRYEEFHVEWTDLQTRLKKKGDDLGAEYFRLVEDISCLHHDYIRDRINKDDYKMARKTLVEEMDCAFANIGMVVCTLGTMFSVARAVAQGVLSPGGFDYGKLDFAACNAVPYLCTIFPRLVKAKTSSIPPDPMAPDPSTLPFKNGLPSYDFHEIMASVWQKHPTKLHDIHKSVFKNCFEGIKELTQMEKDNVKALLGNGREWVI